ncbi:hypothetical protein [Melaminivora sp.]|uniref:hypothetical protein n=1 Tax=Melaminivora sp. TaxID=1933032 RepID=UPI0028A82068|nr:hypothetical protein [Melaminivora sp.]
MEKEWVPGLEELEAGARVSARKHLDSAVEDIDEKFGPGTAVRHPALVAGYMQTIAAEHLAGMTKWYLGDHVRALHAVSLQVKATLSDLADRLSED